VELIPLEKQSIKELIWLVQIQPQKLSVGTKHSIKEGTVHPFKKENQGGS